MFFACSCERRSKIIPDVSGALHRGSSWSWSSVVCLFFGVGVFLVGSRVFLNFSRFLGACASTQLSGEERPAWASCWETSLCERGGEVSRLHNILLPGPPALLQAPVLDRPPAAQPCSDLIRELFSVLLWFFLQDLRGLQSPEVCSVPAESQQPGCGPPRASACSLIVFCVVSCPEQGRRTADHL